MRANLWALLIVIGAASAWAKPPHVKKAPPPATRRTRIDICNGTLITGQVNRAGVTLYERKELKLRSMVKPRDNFRAEIISSIQDS